MRKRIHVVPLGRLWVCRIEGRVGIYSRHYTQASAAAAARRWAIAVRGEVIVHRPDGRIRDSDSYGNDPFPPRG